MIGFRAMARALLVLLVAAFAALQLGRLGGEEALGGHTVRVGVVRSLFPDTPEGFIPLHIRPFKSLLDSQSGLDTDFSVSGEAGDLGRQLVEGKVQLGVFHGVEFAWARLKYPQLLPLVVAVPQRELRACLVVRTDSSVKAMVDLKGKTVALPCHSRAHCRVYLTRLCQECGQTPQRFFAQLTTPANFEQALTFVLNGRIQAAVIDDALLDWYREHDASRFAQLKTVQQSEVFPAGVIAFCPGQLSDAQCERLRDGLLAADRNAHGEKILDLCQICRFVPASRDYERALSAIVKVYPPPPDASR